MGQTSLFRADQKLGMTHLFSPRARSMAPWAVVTQNSAQGAKLLRETNGSNLFVLRWVTHRESIWSNLIFDRHETKNFDPIDLFYARSKSIREEVFNRLIFNAAERYPPKASRLG
ncbi:hypothetical protein LF1_24430 [Rubripirellula obstinata]|uniref:Uncharacterized protein n=1 Tax=Rubripirellula obstinata TaxID=406547 RepID=A0A5B1CH74_9BACT|nr:hypothetical protein LF1_24430 [Rubripirellula obstinata]